MDRKLRRKSARFIFIRMLVFVLLFAITAAGGGRFVPVATAASEVSEPVSTPAPKAEETPAPEAVPASEASEAASTPVPEGTPVPEATSTPGPETTADPEADEIPSPEATADPEADETPSPEATADPEADETPSPEATADPEADETPSPEATADPEADETPAPEEALPTEPPMESPESPRVFLKEEIDAMNPNRKIRFYASWGAKDAPEFGDQITLHAQLSGYEGLEYTIRWQFKKSADDSWQDMGVQGETCTFTLTRENLDWLFRVAVDITDVQDG